MQPDATDGKSADSTMLRLSRRAGESKTARARQAVEERRQPAVYFIADYNSGIPATPNALLVRPARHLCAMHG